ncbi:hypothetical protein [Streptomyces sp. ISL-96]|uniref:hypothetical protein n=1 Tax=Streptomyces sp. ISL-96 TaxID=2819191 RepID=UPI0020360052|nr:hypothetical protein [Streptomyces sp. ISL-96]
MNPPVPRTWTVELRPQQHGPVLYCPICSSGGQTVRVTAARPAALAHLARHARRDVLPAHLRTCQCQERGCRWHPRHRGCSGPVLLVLTRERGGRIWRLADVCAACASATPHAAVVPDTVLIATQKQHPRTPSDPGQVQRKRRQLGPSEQIRVQEMLSYLASALPPSAGAEARLLAVQCALRANTAGRVQLPDGLLRSMRLAHEPTLWHELEAMHWLRRESQSAAEPHRTGISVQLLDIAILAQAPGRPERHRAADWAARTASCVAARRLPATARLTKLALAAYLGPESLQGVAEADRVRRACGLSLHALFATLDQLVTTGAVATWALCPATEDLHWELRT